MNKSVLGRILILGTGLSLSAMAQSSGRDVGWEAGVDVTYQNSTDFDFNGGSTAKLDSDVGLSVVFGYRFSPHLETQFALDWASVDYKVALRTGTGSTLSGNGSYESFTPRANVVFNFLDGPMTPYVMGGIGYAFVDTNIPTGRPSTGCWWDPWYGYVCSSVQPTKSVDGFAYQLGLGGRWDITDSGSLRLSYERHWADLGNGGTQYVDQIRLGYVYRPY
jgi:opacity protein-like surface antigen